MFSAEALVKVLGLFSQREPPAEPFKRSGLTKRDFFHLFPLAKCRKCRGRVRESGEKSSTYLRTAALQNEETCDAENGVYVKETVESMKINERD
ncbi:uncharacterized [Tachysurus ichikawai]